MSTPSDTPELKELRLAAQELYAVMKRIEQEAPNSDAAYVAAVAKDLGSRTAMPRTDEYDISDLHRSMDMAYLCVPSIREVFDRECERYRSEALKALGDEP